MPRSRIHHPLGPVYGKHAKILILGSMPGIASLIAREYYAHPRNQFWDIMGSLVGAGREHDYPERLAILVKNKIALWDVIASCEREGSLDTSIKTSSVTIHSLDGVIADCHDLRSIYFNGKAAEQYFHRHVLRKQPDIFLRFKLTALPSTSPANASLSLKDKTRIWRQILEDTGN